MRPAGLTAALRGEFTDEDVRLGDACTSTVSCRIDPLGGAIASVRDRARSHRVWLLPSLGERATLLAACTCSESDASPCPHLWSVLRVIEARSAWPHDVMPPSSIVMTDVLDPDLELIADDSTRLVSGIRVEDIPVHRPGAVESAARASAGVSWRDLVPEWPSAKQPAAGKLARMEYVLQAVALTEAVRGPEHRGLVDDAACIVGVASVTPGRDGVQRKYMSVDSDRLSSDDLAIRGLLFGVAAIDAASSGRAHRGQPVAARVAAPRVPEILCRLAASGRFGWLPAASGTLVALPWDAAGPWQLELALSSVPEHRVARVTGALVRGEERLPVSEIQAIAGGGVAIAQGRALEVALDGLLPWLCLLRHDVTLALWEVPALVERACGTRRPPKLALGDVGVAVTERSPDCRIVIEPQRRAGFTATAELLYDGRPVDLTGPTVLARERGKLLVRRRLDEEHAWSLVVRELGGTLDAEWSVPAGRLRELVEAAAARRIEVFYAGGAVRSAVDFSANVTSGIDWFDLSIDVDLPGASLELPELLAALRAGSPMIQLTDGTAVMLPRWLERRGAALVAAAQDGDALRFGRAEVLVLSALVDGIADVEVDNVFARARDRLTKLQGMAPSDAPRGFGAALRDYQRDGYGWLRFLYDLGLGGCLADDMGLGKTIQVLALLEQVRARRTRRRCREPHRPSLVVCPKSLVFHWLDEARRFAPRLAMLEWHGQGRNERADQLAIADVIVTTYATLRLDAERLGTIDYHLAILDEAHAIKNAATASAATVRSLRADLRLALTGTPVENRLDDLASIFDYLNPGLLGRPAVLRAIGDGAAERVSGDPAGTPDARQIEIARARALGNVLRPFMLRRTKEQVLTELPAKTEVELTCRLDGEERRRYDELRAHYRRSLLPAVADSGVQRNAILVLEALLRLRQAALHPGLLDVKQRKADSAKLDALAEHLHEAIASGHRALVFSQFTTMLEIISARLRRDQIAYEYLDGKTRDRRERVAAFQRGAAPVFLISLKAGGVGLNLTAADHVFLFDPWWNPAVEAQAIDRVHRIGQGRPVTAYRLVAEDTVEAKILALQAHKCALARSVFDEAGMVASLSTDDLRGLLA